MKLWTKMYYFKKVVSILVYQYIGIIKTLLIPCLSASGTILRMYRVTDWMTIMITTICLYCVD